MFDKGVRAFILVLFLLISIAFAYSYTEERVIQSMNEKGSASVLVIFKDKHNTTKTEPVKGVQRSAARSASVEGMNETQMPIKRNLNSINAYAGEISESDLLKIESDPSVEKIMYVPDMHATLLDSLPLINGTIAHTLNINGTNLTGKGQTICIIDTGIDTDHPFFSGRIIAQKCYCNKCCAGKTDEGESAEDDNGHGTHVAGIAAANSSTYRGVAPDAWIVSVKVLNSTGGGNGYDIAKALDWCTTYSDIYNISVISMSIGDGHWYGDYCSDYYLAPEINASTQKNISVVIASGNEWHTDGISGPACVPSAIAVGSTTKLDEMSDFGNRARFLDIVAPGSSIISSYKGGDIATMSGTSMATPHVAGAIAVLKQFAKLEGNPLLTIQDIKVLLNDTGKRVYDPDSAKNYSRLDLYSAVTEYADSYGIELVAPNIQFAINTPINYAYIAKNYTIINITTDKEISKAFLEINNANNTMNGSGTNWYINISIPRGYIYGYKVYANSTGGFLGSSQVRYLNMTFFIPAIDNLSMISTDPLNRTNGSISFSFVLTDLDSDVSFNQTIWYNGSNIVENIFNASMLTENLTRKNETWTISVRVLDELNQSEYVNASIHINNADPVVPTLNDIIVNASEQVIFNASAIDADEDILFYLINSTNVSNFTSTEGLFIWNTTVHDNGAYRFNITVTDNESQVSQIVTVTILYVRDLDDDGIPDYRDNDIDNDGINDSLDYLIGNTSFINTSGTHELRIYINQSSNISKILNSTESVFVNITDNNETIISFNWTFNSTNILDLGNITIIMQEENATNGSLIINGLNITKTAYIDRIANISYVCIKDQIIYDIMNISTGCNAPGEYFIHCDGIESYGFTCNVTQALDRYIVSELNHSGIREQCQDNDGDGYGVGCLLGVDCNDNDAAKTTTCTTSNLVVNTGGSGGGGGGGGSNKPKDDSTVSNSFISMKSGGSYNFDISKPSIAVSRISISVNRYILKSEFSLSTKYDGPKLDSDQIYQYFEITYNGMNPEDISKGEIYFKIPSKWIVDNSADKNKVKAYRYNSGWESYDASYSGQSGSYYEYKVTVPGFSHFAISADKIPTSTQPKYVNETQDAMPELKAENDTKRNTNDTGVEEFAQPAQKRSVTKLIIASLGILVVILMTTFMIKKLYDNEAATNRLVQIEIKRRGSKKSFGKK